MTPGFPSERVFIREEDLKYPWVIMVLKDPNRYLSKFIYNVYIIFYSCWTSVMDSSHTFLPPSKRTLPPPPSIGSLSVLPVVRPSSLLHVSRNLGICLTHDVDPCPPVGRDWGLPFRSLPSSYTDLSLPLLRSVLCDKRKYLRSPPRNHSWDVSSYPTLPTSLWTRSGRSSGGYGRKGRVLR